MQGWTIFIHSMRMVFDNLAAALRISLVLYLISTVAAIYFAQKYATTITHMQNGVGVLPPPGFWPASLAVAVINLLTSLWIAVGWHRYILLEEAPAGVFPVFKGDRIGAYFWKSILIGLILVVVALVCGAIAGTILFGLFGIQSAMLVNIFVAAPAIYIFYRLCLALPAAALGGQVGFSDSWHATKPASTAILQLVLIGLGAVILIQLPNAFSDNPASMINTIYTHVLGWFIMMGGVSILTTLYGIYFEGRKL